MFSLASGWLPNVNVISVQSINHFSKSDKDKVAGCWIAAKPAAVRTAFKDDPQRALFENKSVTLTVTLFNIRRIGVRGQLVF